MGRHRVNTVEAVKHEAAPTGAVVVYFHETSLTLRYNAGGLNNGWWWEGGRITEAGAEDVLSRHTVRAVVKP